ncbi:MAG: TonB-dependent receptor [Nonlabens sp.]
MKQNYLLLIVALTSLVAAAQNTQPQDTTKTEKLEEVVVKSTRVNKNTPITYSEISKEQLKKVNLGQDIPILLNFLPNVVSTTFDGTGIGYTDIRIRGADNARINVTLNGIPYNDADSQGTFWVNLQDFASSVENIQVQRGIGTSTNGAGAFGASINVLTDDLNELPYAQLSNSLGSFNTRKHTVKIGTGMIDNRFGFNARLSRIESDGFVDRAFSDLRSYYLSGVYRTDNTLVKALVFGGEERTGLSFFGLDRDQLEDDRQLNLDGIYNDRNGIERAYEGQTDNYNQDHYQLHVTHRFNENWTGNISLHYTYGRGFFEQYMDDAAFFDPRFSGNLEFYRLPTFTLNGQTQTSADLVTQAHLNSDFYGTVFSLNYKKDRLDAILGGGYNRYDGIQFGEIITSETSPLPSIPYRFYENQSDKRDFNLYAKATYQITDQLTAYADAQVRNISYTAGGSLLDPEGFLAVDENYTFFNPKAGATYAINERNSIYLSYARASREPARVDFENGNPEPEELNDFELGYRHDSKNFRLNTNLYYLDFRNQLVLTGALDPVGFPLRENSGSSYRLGLEVDAVIKLNDKFIVRPNIALSTNKNRDFVAQRDGALTNFGDTSISFSPEVVAGNALTYKVMRNLELTLFSKYVGEQFMGNLDLEASRLESYFVNDFNVQYVWDNVPYASNITFTAQVNNIFDYDYENNGYVFSFDTVDPVTNATVTNDGAGFYPQAGINFLVGATVNF